jgi:phosphatidylinositol dimannoside acyltransferase
MLVSERISSLALTLRRISSWKFLFYDLLLPALRMLGPARGDAVLAFLGTLLMSVKPRSRRRLRAALEHAALALDADWSVDKKMAQLVANTARFLARDYPLDFRSDAAVLERFEVRGYDRLCATLADGHGAILVGSHLGAHIAGVHWLYRRGVPLRLLVQRPRHVSGELDRRFEIRGPHPQAELFLRRDMSPAMAIERLVRARAALRDGLAIYLNGDIPWAGPNTCAGSLLGRPVRLLAIWTDLAVLTSAPVFLIFCSHRPRGNFSLEIEALGQLKPGEEHAAVSHYLARLETRIATCPADAIAHLVWPCYQTRTPSSCHTRAPLARDRDQRAHQPHRKSTRAPGRLAPTVPE